MARCSPNGHGRRGGRPGNGHQSDKGLDIAATTLTCAAASRASTNPTAWAEYESAIRRWEGVLGHSAAPPAEPGAIWPARLSATFGEWMMSTSGLMTGVPGLPRTAVLRIIGNGVVLDQATATAMPLLAEIAAGPGTLPGTGTGMRAAA
jgi:hypothetical protein